MYQHALAGSFRPLKQKLAFQKKALINRIIGVLAMIGNEGSQCYSCEYHAAD